MKTPIIVCLLTLSLAAFADPAAYLYTTTGLPATIPDNNANGYQNSFTASGIPGPIMDMTITLNLTGGFNGDLYVALDYNNTTAVLLNRVGLSAVNSVGYPDSGFNITLDDSATSDVHFYQTVSYTLNGSGQLTGSWQPDGRLISPLSSGAAIAGATRGNTLGVFDGMDPNGTWTLFAADLSPGGISTLAGYSLAIIAVPEPNSLALIGCVGACGWLWWRLVQRRKGATTGTPATDKIRPPPVRRNVTRWSVHPGGGGGVACTGV